MSNNNDGCLNGAFSHCMLDMLQVRLPGGVFKKEHFMMSYISDGNCILPIL
jgi:hypothetical protein